MGTVLSFYTEKDKKAIEKISSLNLLRLARIEEEVSLKGAYVICTACGERYEFNNKHLPLIKKEIRHIMEDLG